MCSSIRFSIFSMLVLVLFASKSTIAQGRSLDDTNPWWGLKHVGITNAIDAALIVHCWSKNDDLGFHNLRKGETWKFSFHPDFLFRSLFTCNFQWLGQSHHFDIYKQTRDFVYKVIIWEIRSSGPCHGDPFTGKDACFSWK